MNTPTLRRRLACNVYESLLLVAVLFVAAFPLAALAPHLPPSIGVALLRIYLLAVAGIYLTLFWRKGQTLAMKTWDIRLTAANGGAPTFTQVWLRYLLAGLNLMLLGIGWWAALWRQDRQFLQDRLAGTRLIRQHEKGSAPLDPPQG